MKKPNGMTKHGYPYYVYGTGYSLNKIIVIDKKDKLTFIFGKNVNGSIRWGTKCYTIVFKNNKVTVYKIDKGYICNHTYFVNFDKKIQYYLGKSIQTVGIITSIKKLIINKMRKLDNSFKPNKKDSILTLIIKYNIKFFRMISFNSKHEIISPIFNNSYLKKYFENETDLKKIVKRIFNKKYSKPLFKFIAKEIICANIGNIIYLYYVKNLLNTGEIINLVKRLNKSTMLTPAIYHYKIKIVEKFLKQFSSQKIINFSDYIFLLDDCVKMWIDLNEPTIPKTFKNGSEIHNYLSREHRRIKTKNLPIKIPNRFIPIHKISINKFFIKHVENTHELIEWSNILSNCISSYRDKVLENKCGLFGIYENGKLKYNIEVVQNMINQFKGKHNSDPDENDYKIITELFKKEAKIEVPINANYDNF